MRNIFRDNEMNMSWDYLRNVSNDELKAICSTIRTINGFDVKKKDVKEILSNIGIFKLDYQDFLYKILRSLNAPINRSKLSLDFYVLAQLVKYVLENNKVLRDKFCEQERFVSVNTFSSEFDYKINHSRVFAMKLPAYALLLSGAVDAKSLSKMNRNSVENKYITGTLTSYITGVLGSSLLGLSSLVAGPLGVIAAVSFPFVSKSVKSIFGDGISENLHKNWPLYMVLIQIHASHNQQFRSIEEAKNFILEVSSSIKDDIHINRSCSYRKWSDSRLGFLQFLLNEGQDVISITHVPFWKEHLQRLSSNFDISQYIPLYVLMNLLRIPNMDKKQVINELIDFLYGMRATNFEKSYYSSLNKFLVTQEMPEHKVLIVDFCFPFSKITQSTVFYVNKGENDECNHLLTQIYLDIHGYNIPEYFCDNLESSEFDYIFSLRDRHPEFVKCLSKDGLYLSSDTLLQTELENNLSNKLSSHQKDKKIKELEQKVSALERQLNDKIIFCSRFHHDLGNVFGTIISPIKTKKKFPQYVISDDDIEKADKNIELFRELWDRIVSEKKYGEPEKIPAQKLLDNLCKEIKKKWNLRGENITIDNANVNMSESDFCNVVHNLIQNFDRHAFPHIVSQSDPIVNIEVQIIDNQLLFYVSNNGEPYEGDINKFFDYKLDTKKGLGVSSMRECMRHFEGDLNVSLEADHTITYIFSFKIV